MIRDAPSRQSPPPAIDSQATCSWRTPTPSASATTGIRNAVADAVVAPIRPAAVAVSTLATRCRRRRARAARATARGVQCASSTRGNPSGAVSSSATPSARQITGRAPLRCCSGRARLTRDAVRDERRDDQHDARALLLDPPPAEIPGSAISTAPSEARPRARRATPRDGIRRARMLATARRRAASRRSACRSAPTTRAVRRTETC